MKSFFEEIGMRFYTYREKQVLELACGTGQITFRMAPKKHIDSFLRGIPTFAVAAVIVG